MNLIGIIVNLIEQIILNKFFVEKYMSKLLQINIE